VLVLALDEFSVEIVYFCFSSQMMEIIVGSIAQLAFCLLVLKQSECESVEPPTTH
jgi:hypothetical protein